MTAAEFRAWRARMDWSQERAGEEIGRSRERILQYESGDAAIPLVVELACEALDNRRRLAAARGYRERRRD